MIITVTLNPAIDQTVEVDALRVGDVNRVRSMRWDIGGKGINVALVLKELHYEPLAMGFAPGDLGRMIEDQLTDAGIGCEFVYIPGETRTNLTLLDASTRTHTVLSSPGQPVADEDEAEFLRRLERRLRRGTWLVVAGSIPPPGDPSVYARIIEAAMRREVLVGLDADGSVVRGVLDAGATPTLVKVNADELSRYAGDPTDTEERVIGAAERIRARGVRHVVVTRGAEGAVALTASGDFRVRPLLVPVRSAVGAGDSFLAGLLLGLRRGEGWEASLALGTAAGAATCLTAGTMLCQEADVRQLRDRVSVETIERSVVG